MKNSKELYELCKNFIQENGITCEESIYQCDKIAENALEFIESICDLIGYEESEED
jgi:hypothetical protein